MIIEAIKSNCTTWARAIAIVAGGFFMASCANNSSSIPEAEYSTEIVGLWQGTVGDLKETMSIRADSTFVCQLRHTGFLANTLSQGETGMVRGTWKISGATITLKITGSKNEDLRNRIASSDIVTFNEDELELKSDRGKTSAFLRLRGL
jgi:hypothetical protein